MELHLLLEVLLEIMDQILHLLDLQPQLVVEVEGDILLLTLLKAEDLVEVEVINPEI